MISPAAIERLRSAPWLHTAAIGRVFAALAAVGATSRPVGGAVRNTLLGEPVADVDIATDADPATVLEAARRADIGTAETGLAHGTVTLIADRTPFEVTTLRRDVATDGRHATVAFTDDWSLDASRRDFTINALYCNPDGSLFDPLGGAGDLDPPRVRFIGDARQRIREDYLRILRFFRFSARYVDGPLDREGLLACSLERTGLARVSAERIRMELMKLLVAHRAADVCRVMQAYGFLAAMLGTAPSPGRLERLVSIEAAVRLAPDALRRLAALALYPAADARHLARRLRLSGGERSRLAVVASEWAGVVADRSPAADRRLVYRRGVDRSIDALLVAWAGSATALADATWQGRLTAVAEWAVPALPVDGGDAIALGYPPGPAIGQALAAVEAWWMAEDFAPDRAACLAELAQRLAQSN